MKPYFIVGTDTDCGKTQAMCALIAYFKAKQQSVMALKPVASGCERQHNVLLSGDVLRLEQALGEHPMDICRWRFEPPIAPHLAAEQAGITLSAKQIVDFCTLPTWTSYEVMLIEGAGGLLVPLNAHETWIDVLVRAQWPVILVVGMRLGCINHAMLTRAVLAQHGIPCVGWLANVLDPDMLCLEENIQTLVHRLDTPLLARIPYGETSLLHEKDLVRQSPCHVDENDFGLFARSTS